MLKSENIKDNIPYETNTNKSIIHYWSIYIYLDFRQYINIFLIIIEP